MNEFKWNKYIRLGEINKTASGCDFTMRKNDLVFFSKLIDFKNKKVLDIGCEDGVILEELKKEHSCDVSGITLGEISEKNKSFIFESDLHELPFENNSFDVVLIMHTLEHAISPYICLCEINRVLKTGGKVIIIMPEEGDVYTSCKQHYSTMTFRQLFNLLNKTGFIPIRNYRKEYMLDDNEWKRDMLVCWEKNESETKSLLDNSKVYVPSLGETTSVNLGVKLTPVLLFCRLETELMNHFIGRTDSLKTG